MHLAKIAIAMFLATVSYSPKGQTAELQNQLSTEFSYSAPADLFIGSAKAGRVDAIQTKLGYTIRPNNSGDLSWGLGLAWNRNGFGLPAGAALPNTVHELTLNLQAEWKFSDPWSLRLDVRPGLFSDLEDIDTDDFNAPFTFSLNYQQSETLLWVAAINADVRRDIPVIGGLGVRWKFAPDWTLNLLLPKPTVEYAINETLTAFAGGELVGGAYRVANDLGTRSGRPNLNGESLSYREIRIGGGLRAKLNQTITANLEGGWMLDRRFKYENARLMMNGDGAPYVGASFRARF